MVWKTGKFGLNSGNTQRRGPFVTYGQRKSGTIIKQGHDSSYVLEKLEQCLDHSPKMDPFTAEVLLTGVQNLADFIPPGTEYALEKENRWEMVEMIQEELMRLKEIEEEVQQNLGGETQGSDPDATYLPTEVEISLEIVNVDKSFVSKLTFSTVKQKDFVARELHSEIHNRRNWIGRRVGAVQRKDEVKRRVPRAPPEYDTIPGSNFTTTFKVMTGEYSNKQFSKLTGMFSDKSQFNSGKSLKKEKGQRSKFASHWNGFDPRDVDEIINDELDRDIHRRSGFANRMKHRARACEAAEKREAKIQKRREEKAAKIAEKQARKAARKAEEKAKEEESEKPQGVIVPLWHILHLTAVADGKENGNGKGKGKGSKAKVELMSCTDGACSKPVATMEPLAPRPPSIPRPPFSPHPPTHPRIAPSLDTSNNSTDASTYHRKSNKINHLKVTPKATKDEPKITETIVEELSQTKPKKKNRPGQRQRRKQKRKELKLQSESPTSSHYEDNQDQENLSNDSRKTKDSKGNKHTNRRQKSNTGSGKYRKNGYMDTGSIEKPFFVKVKHGTTALPLLRRTFGAALHTSRTFPPRFVLDLSERVHGVLEEFVDLEAEPFAEPWLVVAVEEVKGGGGEKAGPTYSFVWLHVKSELETAGHTLLQQGIESKLKADLIYSMSKIVDIVVSIFEQLPPHCFTSGFVSRLPVPSEPASEKQRARLDWLRAMCDWDIQVFSPAQTYRHFAKKLGPESLCRTPSMLFSSSSSLLTSSAHPSRACGVCEGGGEGEEEEEVERRRVVLAMCGHAVCTDCFHAGLRNQLQQQSPNILCPVPGCGTEVDPGTLLSALSLCEYKRHRRHRHDAALARHPQWTWCPGPKCRRGVKLSGTGLLQGAVTVVCECGADWCFHCYCGNHWPATCQQARDYQAQLQNESLVSEQPILKRIVCTSCSPNKTTTVSTPGGENCNCLYQLCTNCNTIPKTLLQEIQHKQTQPGSVNQLSEDVRKDVSRLAYISRAHHHYSCRQKWNPTQAQLNAVALAKLVQRGTGRPRRSLDSIQPISNSDQSHMIPSRPITVQLSSHMAKPQPMALKHRDHVTKMEKLFLVLAHDCLLEMHTMLEYVYVVLMHGQSENLLPLVLKLETIASLIKQTLYQPRLSPTSILPRLHRLHDNAKSIMAAIARHFSGRSNGLSINLPSPRDSEEGAEGAESGVEAKRRGSWLGNGKKVLPCIGANVS